MAHPRGEDARHQIGARGIQAEEADGHPRPLAGVGADHHALAPQHRFSAAQHQVEEEAAPHLLGRAGGEEEAVAAHVRPVLGHELLLAAERQPDAKRRQDGHGQL
jgi:hypothetical protein